VHPAAWTPEQIESFWDRFSKTPQLAIHYFSQNHGRGILRTLDRLAPLGGTVLDYGCGQGDMLELLCERGLRCLGVDSSVDSVAATGRRLAGRAGFLGAFQAGERLPVTPEAVTLFEVIEHLPAEALVGFLSRAAALLPAGGRIVGTTPHREQLERAQVLCPECACLFHPSQHLASIDPEGLRATAAQAGLDALLLQPTLFPRSADRSLRTRLRQRLVERWPAHAPHLLFVLRKR
jgi:SAM-dependent methyltransferase